MLGPSLSRSAPLLKNTRRYSDVSVRPWNAAATQNRADGKYYDEGWQHALATHPEVISVTSWNEWHEGTQIEPAVPKARRRQRCRRSLCLMRAPLLLSVSRFPKCAAGVL